MTRKFIVFVLIISGLTFFAPVSFAESYYDISVVNYEYFTQSTHKKVRVNVDVTPHQIAKDNLCTLDAEAYATTGGLIADTYVWTNSPVGVTRRVTLTYDAEGVTALARLDFSCRCSGKPNVTVMTYSVPADSGGGTSPGTDPGGGTNPGGTDPGGGTNPGSGGSCDLCSIAKCPGWQDIADLIGGAVGNKLPPPPDWEEVASVFGDELVPRMSKAVGNEMQSVLKEVLGYPGPIPDIVLPNRTQFDGKSGVDLPQPTDSAPPAQRISFDNVPDIQVNPDRTGGIDVSRADPTDSIPHNAPDYRPIPGRETGGIKPQTKPIDMPVPSNGTATPPPVTAPRPQMPAPGTGNGFPRPDAIVTPPPKPEMPMPKNN